VRLGSGGGLLLSIAVADALLDERRGLAELALWLADPEPYD
jgi:hypothetical protein